MGLRQTLGRILMHRRNGGGAAAVVVEGVVCIDVKSAVVCGVCEQGQCRGAHCGKGTQSGGVLWWCVFGGGPVMGAVVTCPQRWSWWWWGCNAALGPLA